MPFRTDKKMLQRKMPYWGVTWLVSYRVHYGPCPVSLTQQSVPVWIISATHCLQFGTGRPWYLRLRYRLQESTVAIAGVILQNSNRQQRQQERSDARYREVLLLCRESAGVLAVAYRVGWFGGGFKTSPEILKALQNRAKLNPIWKLLKIAEFRMPTP